MHHRDRSFWDTWHHMAMSTETMPLLYRDGIPMSAPAPVGEISDLPLTIGAYDDVDTARYLNGKLDELAFGNVTFRSKKSWNLPARTLQNTFH